MTDEIQTFADERLGTVRRWDGLGEEGSMGYPMTPNCPSSDTNETASDRMATEMDRTFSTASRRDLRSDAASYARNASTSSRFSSSSSLNEGSSASVRGSKSSMPGTSGTSGTSGGSARNASTSELLSELSKSVAAFREQISRTESRRRRMSVLSSFTLAMCTLSFIAVLASWLFPHPALIVVDGVLIVAIVITGVPLFVWALSDGSKGSTR